MLLTPTSIARYVLTRPAIAFALGATPVLMVLVTESTFFGDGFNRDGLKYLGLSTFFGFMLAGFTSRPDEQAGPRPWGKIPVALTLILSLAFSARSLDSLLASMWVAPLLTISLAGGAVACVYLATRGVVALSIHPFSR